MLPQVDLITAKLDALQSRLRCVESRMIEIENAGGLVLAENIHAFRDSPSTDVSAMDGYAFRISDLSRRAIPVAATTTAGSAPVHLPTGCSIRIFTGGAVPIGAECIVRREDCIETDASVELNVAPESIRPGQNIRKRGENAKAGTLSLVRGCLLDAVRMAGLVTFSTNRSVKVYEKLRVAIINTGDELIEMGQPLEEWQIRDSNGPLLESFTREQRWMTSTRMKVADQPELIRHAIASALAENDVILMTGGVSMGDTDFVPQSIVDCGGEIMFHRIPIRPGKPMLGAVGREGQLILGLPGNPVSVAVTYRRFGLQLMQYMGGLAPHFNDANLHVRCDDDQLLDLVWFRLVRRDASGELEVVATRGSGDVASLSISDGFVEVPAGEVTAGVRRFFAW